MRANEKRRALYDAVSAIDPKLVQEATAPRHRKVTRIVWRVAACAAVVALLIGAMAGFPLDFGQDEEYVTAPGGLTIRAYALNENEITDVNSTVLTEGVELPWEYTYSPAINSIPALPINFDFPTVVYAGIENMYINLEISTTSGSFVRDPLHRYDPELKQVIWDTETNLGNQITVSNNSTIYWSVFCREYDADSGKYVSTGVADRIAFVDVIVRADNHIIGCAVLKIYERFPAGETQYIEGVHCGYLVSIEKIVSFPQIDGEFQPVSRRYVEQKFEELHRNV